MPDWEKVGKTGKQGFDTVWGWADKIGAPVNKLSNKIGSEAFWPTTLDKESEKAARILQSFCKDGFYTADERPTQEARNLSKFSKQRVVKKIPEGVIKRAKGLAIFTVMRTGLWISGAGGSGVLLARMENGEWSPPSGILIHTAAAGFVFGADIYDCVVVINSEKALEAFRSVRVTLGGELSAVAGPVGVGAVVDVEVHAKTPPIFTYMKSRGLYAGLGANGTIVIERRDENKRFYMEEARAVDILSGNIRHVPEHDIKVLMTTIKAAQGDGDIDMKLLPDNRPTPGDLELERMSDTMFGLPSADDPDPFGIHALENEGFEIKEAGTGLKPSTEMLEYNPVPSSPAYSALHRKSLSKSIGSLTPSGGTNHAVPKHKMSNPRMVYYSDNGMQTMTAEEREEEVARAFTQRSCLGQPEVELQTDPNAPGPEFPPQLPVRRVPPALPPRLATSPQLISTPLGTTVDGEQVTTQPDYQLDEHTLNHVASSANDEMPTLEALTIQSAHSDKPIVGSPPPTSPSHNVEEMEDIDLHGSRNPPKHAVVNEQRGPVPGAFE